jgi:hypothetical protein
LINRKNLTRAKRKNVLSRRFFQESLLGGDRGAERFFTENSTGGTSEGGKSPLMKSR